MSASLEQEIAAAAARLIAESGLDYQSAKRKAARDLLGSEHSKLGHLPSQEQVEQALREYQRLFQADTQPHYLHQLRKTAWALMSALAHWELVVVGAVANGTAGEYSDIYLQCVAESSKDLYIDLLNLGIEADADEIANPFGKGSVERLSFEFQQQVVHVTCYSPQQKRQISEAAMPRLNATQLEKIVLSEVSIEKA